MVENRKFLVPHLYLASLFWSDPVGISRFRGKLWRHHAMKKFDGKFSRFDTIHERDRQTDGRTDGRHQRPRYAMCIASRGKMSHCDHHGPTETHHAVFLSTPTDPGSRLPATVRLSSRPYDARSALLFIPMLWRCMRPRDCSHILYSSQVSAFRG